MSNALTGPPWEHSRSTSYHKPCHFIYPAYLADMMGLSSRSHRSPALALGPHPTTPSDPALLLLAPTNIRPGPHLSAPSDHASAPPRMRSCCPRSVGDLRSRTSIAACCVMPRFPLVILPKGRYPKTVILAAGRQNKSLARKERYADLIVHGTRHHMSRASPAPIARSRSYTYLPRFLY